MHENGKRVVKKVKLDPPGTQSLPQNLDIMQKLILQYSEKYKIGTERILELIEQLSGNFSDLQEVIENKKENILWTADDDLKLSSSKNKNDKNYKTLLSHKGQERIKERCLFKSILLPFWNWLTIYNQIYNYTI